MNRPVNENNQPIEPTNKEVALAEKTSRLLANYLKKEKNLTLQLTNSSNETDKIVLPKQAAQLLVIILERMGQGESVSINSLSKEITTQQAADLLNVSRPYLVKLLDKGTIPYRKVGTKRRVLAEDILAYKTEIKKRRLKALEELTKQAQDLNLGYND